MVASCIAERRRLRCGSNYQLFQGPYIGIRSINIHYIYIPYVASIFNTYLVLDLDA